jgi:regulatory protein
MCHFPFIKIMKITSIKQQVKAKERFSVYVDGVYSFSLSDTLLLESGLAAGRELTAAQIEGFRRLSAEDKIYNYSLRYAAMRRRSRWEMGQYLERKDAPPALAEIILNKLCELGLVDDEDFAKAWVENRHLLRPTSRRKLQQELRAKHVADEIIQKVLRDDETSDKDGLRALIERKRRQTKYQDNTKLMQYLARQGFGYEDIKTALSSLSESDEDSYSR